MDSEADTECLPKHHELPLALEHERNPNESDNRADHGGVPLLWHTSAIHQDHHTERDERDDDNQHVLGRFTNLAHLTGETYATPDAIRWR